MEHRPRLIVALARLVRRRLVWLLVGVYALAALVPGPGLALRELELSAWSPGGTPARFSLWMVAVLLFSGAVSTDFRKLSELARRPGALGLALVGVWLPPLLLVAAWGAIVAWWSPGEASAGVLLGIALAAAMPVANSAVGWTQQSGGSLVWALGLVVLSISLSPWITPGLLWLMGLTLSASDAQQVELLVARFSGTVFVVWVLAPTLLGFFLQTLVGEKRIERGKPLLLLASAASLLLLNYANGAVALPRALSEPNWPLLGATVAVALSLSATGLLVGWWLARIAHLPRRDRTAWAYALSMKNTGLALCLADNALAGTALNDTMLGDTVLGGTGLGGQSAAILVILVATLAQHGVASLAHAWCASASKNTY